MCKELGHIGLCQWNQHLELLLVECWLHQCCRNILLHSCKLCLQTYLFECKHNPLDKQYMLSSMHQKLKKYQRGMSSAIMAMHSHHNTFLPHKQF